MSRIDEIYAQLEHARLNVGETVRDWKAQGRQVIGMFPVYAPIEIVCAAGMLPVDCWGAENIPIVKASAVLPPYACPVVQTQTELAASGAYDDLDMILCSVPCDTFRCSDQNIAHISGIPTMVCAYPQINKTEEACHFLRKEFQAVRSALETLSGKPITDDMLWNSIAVCNAFRTEILRFVDILRGKPGIVSAKFRRHVIQAGGFMEKETYTALLREMNDLLEEAPAPAFTGKRLYLAGISCGPDKILDILDQLNFAVVGDELAQESRRYRIMVAEDGPDPLECMARAFQNHDSCTFTFPNRISRPQYIYEQASQRGADGILYCQMAFCDMEMMDFPDVRQFALKRGMPLMDITIDPIAASYDQNLTRLQSFNELLHI